MFERADIRGFFKSLNKETIHLVDEFYDAAACFEDPLGKHQGIARIRKYYAHLYQNVQSIDFTFQEEVVQGSTHVLPWRMDLVSKLNSGRPLSLDGISYIEFGGERGKAIFHRDYFDMGAFVYEGVPLLGGIIRFIKGQLKPRE